MRFAFTSLIAAQLLCGTIATADDWPQWMGPQRDGVWTETGVIAAVPDGGLPVRWRVPVHYGYAGPAVAGDRVFVTDFVTDAEIINNPGAKPRIPGTERVLCLHADSGEIVWKYEYDQPYEVSYPGGPRTTPTVDGDRVYTLGAEGRLLCLSVADGDVVWSKDFKTDYGAATPHWGHSAHPLVHGDTVICLVGGSGSAVVAFHKQTGEEVWRSLSSKDVGYCPPTMAGEVDPSQLLVWLPDTLHGLDAETGRAHWSIDLKPDFGMSIAAPAVAGAHAFVSGVGNVSVLLDLKNGNQPPETLWRGKNSTSISLAHCGPIIVEDVIYGCDEKGWLRAVDLQTGERLWESVTATGARPSGYGSAFLARNGSRFYLFNDQGDFIVASMTREGYTEHGRFHVLEPTNEAFGRNVVWSHPAFAGRCLFARNDQEIVCVSLAAD